MNCYHFRATQKSIPDAQELIWLGGGGETPTPPGPLGLITHLIVKILNNINDSASIHFRSFLSH